MAKRTIKHKAFTYSVEVSHPVEPGKKVLVERLARRGDEVDLRPEDIERGERFDAFLGKGEEQPDPSAAPVVSNEDNSVESLESWLDGDSPNVKDTVARAGGNPEVAAAILEAENRVTGNDPRQGVVDGLEKIIDKNE